MKNYIYEGVLLLIYACWFVCAVLLLVLLVSLWVYLAEQLGWGCLIILIPVFLVISIPLAEWLEDQL